MNGVLSFWLTILVIILSVGRICAQDQKSQRDLTEISLEELMKIEVGSVYSASKYFQKVTEAPSSVSIVTSEEIRRYGYRTLADALRSVRGFYVTNDRNYSYLGVRGFARPGDYNTHTLLLVDGHRINDNVFDGATLGMEFPVDVDLIERVEIVRGPSSSLYGTSAFFAVINIITKQGHDAKGLEVSIEAASYRTYKTRFSYGHKFDRGLEMFLSGSYYNSHGQRLYYQEYDTPETNHGIAENADRDRSLNLLANLAYRDFTLRGIYGSRQKNLPTGVYSTVFNDARTKAIDQRGYLDLRYQHSFENNLEMLARVSYDRYHYGGTYIIDYSEDTTPLITDNEDNTKGEWWDGELQFTKFVLNKHKLTFGTEYRDNLRQDQGNYDVSPYYLYLDDRRKSKNGAFYLQNEFIINENLTLNAGVRYDHYSAFGGTTKPRLGLIYRPAAKTFLKLLYGEAFRAPNSYELYYEPGINYKANPDLRPEEIRTTEAVLEHYLGDHLRFSASGYLYRINGLISQQIDPIDSLITYRNVEKIQSKGLEFEMETRLHSGIEGRISYTLQDTRDQRTDEVLTNSPKHLAKFNLSVPLIRQKLFTSLELQYMSKRRTLDGSDTEGFWVTNLTLLSRKLIKGLDLSLSAYNLFNRKYGDPGSSEHRQNTIEQDGRNLRLKLTYRFGAR